MVDSLDTSSLITALPGSDPIAFAGSDLAAENIYGGPGRADALGSDPGAPGSDLGWHRDRILVVPTDGWIGIGIGSWNRCVALPFKT